MSNSRHSLAVQNRSELHQALGRLAIAYTHLELILRYTVKTLSGLSGAKGFDPTRNKPISDFLKKIKKRFKKINPSATEKNRLDELLEKARLLSEMRNSYLYRALSETEAGQAVLHGEGPQWELALSEAEVEQVTSEILSLGEKLNHERLHGFIHEVVQRQPPNAQASP
jgi:hypothetical protein